ncbi:MAG: hypothetical protein GWM87_05160, partial [Xanthomonadales bacterium]|nr:hypothetical protein [Xanthomonadales bacterium]NIX12383.1 hypothetical protein [Xanthomonadales bacterium]
VGGLERGVIEVTEDEGKLRWSDPQEGDDLLLDFEVLGQVIEVYFDGLVILETLFPDA